MNGPFRIIKGGVGPRRPERSAIALTAGQQRALEKVKALTGCANVIGLAGEPGMGRTTLMRVAGDELDASYVGLGDLVEGIGEAEPQNWDIALLLYLKRRLSACDILFVDGLHGFTVNNHSYHGFFAQRALTDALLRAAEESGKTLVLGGPVGAGELVFGRADVPVVELPRYSSDDYGVIARNVMGDSKASGIDFAEAFRFAPYMTGHELRVTCGIAVLRENLNTSSFLGIISDYVVTTNTRTEEVEEINFHTMPGMEALADSLETHIVLPLTDLARTSRLDLKAKRGVLLYGPPGTGKTSVGRALAHRLKGRFFLIDGSVKTEPATAFSERVQTIVAEAVANAPSILFIDDADVLFDIGHAAGLGRYLLTLLDGLAGEKAGHVTVMMTAMDARKVPEAVLRSGRIELWLETRLPDAGIRAGILRRWMGAQLPRSEAIDYERLAAATEGFTPADLRRVAGDARAFYAADVDRKAKPSDGTSYVLDAIQSVVSTRRAMAANLADPSLRVG